MIQLNILVKREREAKREWGKKIHGFRKGGKYKNGIKKNTKIKEKE